jgi:hypothetical protein
VILLKSLNEIYEGIRTKFFNKTKLDIEEGTAIDSYVMASSEAIHEAHVEIENNKNPHIYTGLKEESLDELGLLLQVPRYPNENDKSYLYRLMNWKLNSEASNATAIENSLMNMKYASMVTYIPLTHGTSTGTAYIIPKDYNNDSVDKAIYETINRLTEVVSPSVYITYLIPKPKKIKLVAYITSENGDMKYIQENIKRKVQDYINSIPPGEKLEIGAINKIGVNEDKVNYFKIAQVYVSDKVTTSLSLLQTTEDKFLFEDIIWWTAVK